VERTFLQKNNGGQDCFDILVAQATSVEQVNQRLQAVLTGLGKNVGDGLICDSMLLHRVFRNTSWKWNAETVRIIVAVLGSRVERTFLQKNNDGQDCFDILIAQATSVKQVNQCLQTFLTAIGSEAARDCAQKLQYGQNANTLMHRVLLSTKWNAKTVKIIVAVLGSHVERTFLQKNNGGQDCFDILVAQATSVEQVNQRLQAVLTGLGKNVGDGLICDSMLLHRVFRNTSWKWNAETVRIIVARFGSQAAQRLREYCDGQNCLELLLANVTSSTQQLNQVLQMLLTSLGSQASRLCAAPCRSTANSLLHLSLINLSGRCNAHTIELILSSLGDQDRYTCNFRNAGSNSGLDLALYNHKGHINEYTVYLILNILYGVTEDQIREGVSLDQGAYNYLLNSLLKASNYSGVRSNTHKPVVLILAHAALSVEVQIDFQDKVQQLISSLTKSIGILKVLANLSLNPTNRRKMLEPANLKTIIIAATNAEFELGGVLLWRLLYSNDVDQLEPVEHEGLGQLSNYFGSDLNTAEWQTNFMSTQQRNRLVIKQEQLTALWSTYKNNNTSPCSAVIWALMSLITTIPNLSVFHTTNFIEKLSQWLPQLPLHDAILVSATLKTLVDRASCREKLREAGAVRTFMPLIIATNNAVLEANLSKIFETMMQEQNNRSDILRQKNILELSELFMKKIAAENFSLSAALMHLAYNEKIESIPQETLANLFIETECRSACATLAAVGEITSEAVMVLTENQIILLKSKLSNTTDHLERARMLWLFSVFAMHPQNHAVMGRAGCISLLMDYIATAPQFIELELVILLNLSYHAENRQKIVDLNARLQLTRLPLEEDTEASQFRTKIFVHLDSAPAGPNRRNRLFGQRRQGLRLQPLRRLFGDNRVHPGAGGDEPDFFDENDARFTPVYIPKQLLILGGVIGAGTYGVVYKAQWIRDIGEKTVAVKCFTDVQIGANKEKNIRDEVKNMRLLRHTNIVTFFGLSKAENNDPMIVMEHAEKGSLRQYLEANDVDNVTWSLRLRIAYGIANGLAYMHEQLFVHRDLKSPNILLSNQLEPKLCDFGLTELKVRPGTTHTDEGGQTLIGSVRWMAPELVQKIVPPSTKVDIWALGMLFFELVTHDLPFNHIIPNALVIKALERNEKVTVPRSCQRDQPAFASVMSSCWEIDPQARPTAEEVKTRLQACL